MIDIKYLHVYCCRQLLHSCIVQSDCCRDEGPVMLLSLQLKELQSLHYAGGEECSP